MTRADAAPLIVLTALVCLLAAPHARSQEPAAPPAEAPAAPAPVADAIMPVSEVRAGMAGYGLTALQGVRPERFNVEVLGVLKGAFAKGDMILVRMEGRVINEAGIISGMSGSPVYIDGRLIGAVAYGWRYTKIPLAGVTPAADMLTVRRLDAEAASADAQAAREAARYAAQRRLAEGSRELAQLLAQPARSDETALEARRLVGAMLAPAPRRMGTGPVALPPSVRAMVPQGLDGTPARLPIPLALGGAAAGGMQGMLESAGFLPVQAAAAGGLDEASARPAAVEPGMPVGAVLVSGDMDATGMGTLTWTEGDLALAFGHSMFGSGETDLPLAVGDVQTIVPSVVSSFKLSVTGPVIGRLTQDREAAVLARLGERAPTFPCTVKVRGAVDDDYRYTLAGYWEVAPMCAMLATTASSARWEGSGNRYTLAARSRIKLKGIEEPVELHNDYADFGTVGPGTELVAMPLRELLTNPFREVQVEEVDYEIDVQRGFDVAAIEAAWADRVEAEPGSEVQVFVRLLHYRGAEDVRKLTLKVPDTAKPDTQVQVLVCDAMTNRSVRRELDPGLYMPRTFEGLLARVKDAESNRNLVMRASFFDAGLRYGGADMPALPPSAVAIMTQNAGSTRAAPLTTDVVQSVPTPWVLEGAQMITLTIKERPPLGR